MLGYKYNFTTSVYQGPEEIYFDPVDGTPQVPAFTTLVAPPSSWGENEMPVWNRIDMKWELKPIIAEPGGGGVVEIPLLDYLAQKRWLLEQGGFSCIFNGENWVVATDDTSQLKIFGMAILAKENPNFSTVFKFMDGQVREINASDGVYIGSMLAQHIQRTFRAYGAVFADIKNGVVKTVAEVDAAFQAAMV